LFLFQVERPVTLKKDGIQTRNRKLSQKSKKKKAANMVDFFRSGLVDPRYGYGGGMMAGMGGHHSSHHHPGGPMSGYYHQMAASPMASMASSQFMPSGMGNMYMSSMTSASPNAGGGGGGGSPGLVGLSSHHGHHAFSLGPGSSAIPGSSMVAGATA
jgi:hypothetical protein